MAVSTNGNVNEVAAVLNSSFGIKAPRQFKGNCYTVNYLKYGEPGSSFIEHSTHTSTGPYPKRTLLAAIIDQSFHSWVYSIISVIGVTVKFGSTGFEAQSVI